MEKILIFTTHFSEIGGFERLAVELAIELNRVGVEADLLGQFDDIDHCDIFSRNSQKTIIENIHYLDFQKYNLLSICRAAYRLRRIIKLGGYSTLEVSGFAPTFLAIISLFGVKINIVVGVHAIYTSKSFYHLKYLIWKQFLKRSNHVAFYAVSKEAANAWKNYLNININRVSIIPNNINPSFFLDLNQKEKYKQKFRESIGASNKDRCILFVGRLLKSKGIDTIFEAFKNILISHDIQLIFVGREDHFEDLNDAKLLNDIRIEIQKSLLNNRVHFLGVRGDIAKIMISSDVLVHPARSEAFGLVLAEALQCGLPIVASNVGGIPETLSGTYSTLVPPENPDLLREAVLSMFELPEEKLALIKDKGKQRAKAFSVAKRARNFRNLLKDKGYDSL